MRPNFPHPVGIGSGRTVGSMVAEDEVLVGTAAKQIG
ncbi:MAG: hypothetical protein RLZZ77_2022 [Bacteroidota bacterium]